MAFCAYFAVTQEIARIAGVFGVVIFLIATLIAFLDNDIGGIITNYVYFLVGAAFGGIGSAFFNAFTNR